MRGRTSAGETTTADPLAQGMILTAIVITMGIAAFVLALTYRSYRLTTAEEIDNDPEDTRVAEAPDDDSADDSTTRPRRVPRHRRARRTRRPARAGGLPMTRLASARC